MIAIGVDLGKSRDPSAIAVVEMAAPTFTLSGVRQPEIVEVTHLERVPLGIGYPEVRARIEKLAEVTFFLDPDLVIDAGGPGRPVVDDLRARNVRRVISVQATGGASETRTRIGQQRAEDWNVSKSVLWGALSQLVYSGRLRAVPSLAEAPQLLKELSDLESRVSDAGRETFTVAEGQGHHADLVSALALAVWRLQRPRLVGKVVQLPRKVL